MALFRRKKQPAQTQIPELQDYYATQKKESTAMAWLLAIGSLVVTVALFIGLFLGGRWLYRSVTNKDDTSNTSTTQSENKPADNSSNTTTQPNPNDSANINSGTVTAPSTGSSTTTAPAPGVSPNQTDSTNSSATAANTSLPNSGPGSIAVIFVLTALAGTALYRRILLSKN